MIDMPSKTRLALATVVAALAILIVFFRRLHKQRSMMKDLPGPPHHYIFGSLIAMGKVAASNPRNVAPQSLMQAIKEYYNLGDHFYLDPWPLGQPMLVIADLDLLDQITVKNTTPKHNTVHEFLTSFGGPGNLVTSEGLEWKKWRSVFNPGFSNRHLMTMTDMIVKEVAVFCELMTERATNNTLFRMEPVTTKFAINVIGRIVLDLDLQAQKGSNDLVDAFESQTRYVNVGAQYKLSELFDIRYPLMRRYNTWKMNRYISRCLAERYASHAGRGRSKYVADLALDAYMKEVKGKDRPADVKALDKDFKEAAISNMKTFIFAGHDTTSSTICYAFYYLSKYPSTLARMREEHDNVFGTDPLAVPDRLSENAHLLNQLDFTLAVIKEVLRLQPPASTVRTAPSSFTLYDPKSIKQVPVHGFMLYPTVTCMHRNPRYWKDPNGFDPARFLPGSTDNTSAWIPFSKGNRNCIGQDLALIEVKVVLAMFVRRFDFIPAYEDVDKLKNDGTGYPSLTQGVLEHWDDRAYQIQRGAAKPNEGMPCRIRLRE